MLKMRLVVIYLFAAILQPAFTASATAQNSTDHTEYFAVILEGKKVGHALHDRQVTADTIINTETMEITIARAGTSMKIKTTEKHIETADAKPKGFEFIQEMNGVGQTIKGQINPAGKMKVTTEVMGTANTRVMDYPRDAIMAEALRQKQMQTELKPGASGSAKFFSPAILMAVETTWQVGAKQEVDLFGRVVELREIKSAISAPTGSMNVTSYVDDDLYAQKVIIPMIGMKLELVSCTKEVATGPIEVVDLFEKTFIKSPRRLTEKDTCQKLVYHIKPKPERELYFASTGAQQVENKEGMFIITVSPPADMQAQKYTGDDPEILKYLKPTSYIQSDDPKIKQLAEQVKPDKITKYLDLGRVEKFVGEYISDKNLSVGYATAAEVAKSKQGDCSEHALLTAAILRALGIPSRVVSGIVYADVILGDKPIFGGHAWTQAWIEGKWVDIDSTGHERGGFGSGHIAMATGNGEPSDFFSMINTLGNFTIEKIETLEE